MPDSVATLTLTACPVCASAEGDPAGLATLRRCSRCGAVYAPEYADPEEVFVEGYLSGGTDAFGIDVTHPRFRAYLDGVAERRVDALERAAGAAGSLLDVGSGRGELLARARARGWRVAGVEPVADSARHAREVEGLDVECALLEDASAPERAFDVVCAFHVLEHMAEPVPFLRRLARHAHPGGLVVVEVPNFAARLREQRGEDWPHLRPLEHLVHYEPETLRRALVEAGLEPVEVRSPTWVGPPQSLGEALADLARPTWTRRLAPFARGRDDHGARVPGRVAWAALRAAERSDDRDGRGMVVLAAARVA